MNEATVPTQKTRRRHARRKRLSWVIRFAEPVEEALECFDFDAVPEQEEAKDE